MSCNYDNQPKIAGINITGDRNLVTVIVDPLPEPETPTTVNITGDDNIVFIDDVEEEPEV